MKFCKDCKHYDGNERCEAPQAYNEVNLVTGEKKRAWTLCSILRELSDYRIWLLGKRRAPEGHCGKSAHWFEPK